MMNASQPNAADSEKPLVYDEEQEANVSEHIESYFGESQLVLHESTGTWVHVDVHIISPTPGCNMYTLVTQGMGARPFADEEGQPLRCELVLNLPPDWVSDPEDWNRPDRRWPVALMTRLARFPFVTGEPIRIGHSFDFADDLRESGNMNFAGVVLLPPGAAPEGAEHCSLELLPSEGEEEYVQFFQLMPLFAEELRLLLDQGIAALLDRCTFEMMAIADPNRLNAVADAALIDEEKEHEEALSGCRTLTDFVSYCVEHDLIRSGFTARHAEADWALRTAVEEELRDEGMEEAPVGLLKVLDGPLQCWATQAVLEGAAVVVVYRDAVPPINSGWDSGLNFLSAEDLLDEDEEDVDADEAEDEEAVENEEEVDDEAEAGDDDEAEDDDAAEDDAYGEGTRLRLTNLPRIVTVNPQLLDILDIEPGERYVLGDDGAFHLQEDDDALLTGL